MLSFAFYVSSDQRTGYSFKKGEIDAGIVHRIHKLFKVRISSIMVI